MATVDKAPHEGPCVDCRRCSQCHTCLVAWKMLDDPEQDCGYGEPLDLDEAVRKLFAGCPWDV